MDENAVAAQAPETTAATDAPATETAAATDAITAGLNEVEKPQEAPKEEPPASLPEKYEFHLP